MAKEKKEEEKELTANEKKGLENKPQQQLTRRKPSKVKEVKSGN